MIKRNFKLCMLMVVLSHQFEVVMAGGKVVYAKKQSSVAMSNSGESNPAQARMSEVKKQEAAQHDNKNMVNGIGPQVKGNNGIQKASDTQSSKGVTGFAKSAAIAITAPFMYALRSVDSAVGLSTVCSTHLVKPISDAWLQARKLQVQNGKVVRGENGALSFDMSNAEHEQDLQVSDQERGLLNQKIDNIVNSVVAMYKQGASFDQIGTFVSNSIELALAIPVVGMGAGAGLMVGGAGGGAIGALGGAVAGLQFMPHVVVVGDAGPFVAGALLAGPMVGAGLGGVYGAGVGAYEGVGKGADYASKFLRKPLTTIGEAIYDTSNLPSHIASHFSSDAMGLNNHYYNSGPTYVIVG